MAAKKLTFEQAISKLENIVDKMDSDETSLEDSVKLYKEGIELSVFCSERINVIENEVAVLKKTSEGRFFLKAFDE